MYVNNQLHPKLKEIALKADKLRSKTIAGLQGFNDGYNQGKIQSIEKLNQAKKEWLFQNNNEMAQLRRDFFDMVDEARSDLMSKAFAPLPSERAEFRGVYAGLLQVKEAAQIERAYQDAIRFNDIPAMKAVVARAADLGVMPVVNNYKARDANFAKYADELAEYSAAADDIGAKVQAKMRLTGIKEPQLKQQDLPFGHTMTAEGHQAVVTRPFFFYEDYDAPTEADLQHEGATGDIA
jgi:hypothetical protein